MSPSLQVCRQLALAWGIHAVSFPNARDVSEMIWLAMEAASEEGFASSGDIVVIAAGLPFGESGTTNLLHIGKCGDPVPVTQIATMER